MSLAKRTSRILSVDGVRYRWAVSPDSGHLWLVVEHADRPGQRIEASFVYHDVVQPDGAFSEQRRSVSPGVVRAVVEHALANGWQPEQGGLKPLRVDGEAIQPLR